jgi:DNA-binding transcriptional regulator YiaG
MADRQAKGRQARGERLSLRLREREFRGEAVGTAKLTEVEVRRIRSQRDTKAAVLAEIYGVSIGTIHAVRQRRRWRHVPD